MSPAAKPGPPTNGLSMRSWRCSPAASRPADRGTPMTRVFDVTETRDKAELRDLLAVDPVCAAYLLGDLVEPFFSQCRWLVASYRDRLEGAVLLYTGLSVPALL